MRSKTELKLSIVNYNQLGVVRENRVNSMTTVRKCYVVDSELTLVNESDKLLVTLQIITLNIYL